MLVQLPLEWKYKWSLLHKWWERNTCTYIMQHFQLYDGLKGIRFHQTILWWLLILLRWIHLLHRCCYYFCNESGLPAKQSQIQKLTAKFSMDRCIISSQCGKTVTPIPRHRSPTTPMAAMQTYTKHLHISFSYCVTWKLA